MTTLNRTIEIPLTKGHTTVIDVIDADLAELNWFANPSSTKSIYARSSKTPRQYLHRVIMARVLNRELQRHEQIDHIDTNTLNNSRSNLRLASKAQNMRNTHLRVSNSSGYKGVYYRKDRNKWVARITVDYKNYNLGCFSTVKEAYQAYCDAALKFFGEFARF